ncbi:hypothetical protein C4K08_5429 [Pseudomonas chlororaphis subsp. aureofaciens]|nr:hypothetical protein C4K08_5429 [Pseudomonas chlororaphis subsp. aureofaciens]
MFNAVGNSNNFVGSNGLDDSTFKVLDLKLSKCRAGRSCFSIFQVVDLLHLPSGRWPGC